MAARKRPPPAVFALARGALTKRGENRTAAEKAAIRSTRPWRPRVGGQTQVPTNAGGWYDPTKALTPQQITNQVNQQAQASIQPGVDQFNRTITQEQAQAAAARSAMERLQAAVMPYLQNAAAQTGQGYQQAAAMQGQLAGGFAGELRDTANQQAQTDAQMLGSFGVPQEGIDRFMGVAGDNGAGNVLYGLGGFIPGSSLGAQGAAAQAYANQFPGIASQVTRENVLGSDWRSAQTVRDLRQQINDLQSRLPDLRRQIRNDLQANELAKFGARTSYELARGNQALDVQGQTFDQSQTMWENEQALAAAKAEKNKRKPWKSPTTIRQEARAEFTSTVAAALPGIFRDLQVKQAMKGDDYYKNPTFGDVKKYIMQRYAKEIAALKKVGVTDLAVNKVVAEAMYAFRSSTQWFSPQAPPTPEDSGQFPGGGGVIQP